ncbi:MAG TPA: hypothetical protein VME24_03515 [Alphaproteobacteria bacterium]|nr:hypothetical protein [Alphaproteobacteria bacterium]
MNIRSAELLQNALQNAAENALRNRELQQTGQLEAQRIAVENAFRQAQMEHYNQMENRQQGFYNKMQQDEQDRALLGEQNQARQQQETGLANAQEILKVAMQLNSTGQLSDKGGSQVNGWLSTDPNLSRSGIQLSAPPNPSNDPIHQQTALAGGIALREKYMGIAGNPTATPDQKADALKVVRIIDANLGGKEANAPGETDPDEDTNDGPGNAMGAKAKGFGGQPQPQAPSQTQTDIQPTPPFLLPGSVPVTQPQPGAGAVGAGAAAALTPWAPVVPGLGVSATNANGIATGRLHIPTIQSQSDYDALPAGTTYMDSMGRTAVKGPPVPAQPGQ